MPPPQLTLHADHDVQKFDPDVIENNVLYIKLSLK